MFDRQAKRNVLIVWFILVCLSGSVHGQTADIYLWEMPIMVDVDTQGAAAEIDILRDEIDRILAAPALAPLRLNFSDLLEEGYWVYIERGRIITTLAAAYPYLLPDQQEAVQVYVRTMLESGEEAPWHSPLKSNGEGAERHDHQHAITLGRYPHFPDTGPVPTLHVLYGLWLYAERSGDWETVSQYWEPIKQYYADNRETAILYGQLGGFIGMARMAYQLDDTETLAAVEADARSQFDAALDIDLIAARQQTSTFGFFDNARKDGFFPGQPWMFLNASPEVMRYINDHADLRAAALDRVDQFLQRYPVWWLVRAPYFSRWTGDESIGLTPESFGIHMPFERWVRQTEPAQLRSYMRSAPLGTGDLYWIEALVTAIEATGQVCWQDVRSGTPTCEAGS